MILVYFPLSLCVDDVVSYRTNYEFTSVIFLHFMNSARLYWNMYICLNQSWRYKHNQFERRDEKPRHQRLLFQNVDNFYN